jgi:D-alanine-D-alanine ligase
VNVADFGKVAVLMGGISTERKVSLKSGRAVLASLLKSGVDATEVDAGYDLYEQMRRKSFDRAFIALHGQWGEDGIVQGGLEMMNIPYTGSGVLASALGMDKLRSKRLWNAMGVITPEFIELKSQASFQDVENWLGYPVVVKPACEGSSLGMSIVKDPHNILDAWKQARGHDDCVFAERYIKGPEYTVSILDKKALPAICVETESEFYDYDAKYLSNDTRYRCPAGLPEKAEKKLADIALRAFDAVGCQGWGRVDFLIDENGTPYVLEVNTVPGLTDHSLVPMAAKQAGISFDQLILKILETSDADRR